MIKAFAFYFPQLYRIAENDAWWGEGFTDWDLVRKARPLIEGQLQPRVPLSGYHDQSDPRVLLEQSRLLKKFGLSGFNFYHYWFDGKVLLDAPINNLLLDKTIDVEYMVTWANESWTRQWVGKPNDYLIRQTYASSRDKVGRHYNYLRSFFHDPRYVKVSGSPVLCIYRPELIPDLPKIQEELSNSARHDGFSGLHFVACRSYDIKNAEALYSTFDGVIDFNPRYVLNRVLRRMSKYRTELEKVLRKLPEGVQSRLASIFRKNSSYQVFDYAAYLAAIAKTPLQLASIPPVYPCVFPDWDNTARYGGKATFFRGSTPALFAQAVRHSCDSLADSQQQWLFINAWNEWSEAAYLEPDEAHGLAYLEALQKVLVENVS